MPLLHFIEVQIKIWNLNGIFADCNEWKCLGCLRWKCKEDNAENEHENAINTRLTMLLLAKNEKKEKKEEIFFCVFVFCGAPWISET